MVKDLDLKEIDLGGKDSVDNKLKNPTDNQEIPSLSPHHELLVYLMLIILAVLIIGLGLRFIYFDEKAFIKTHNFKEITLIPTPTIKIPTPTALPPEPVTSQNVYLKTDQGEVLLAKDLIDTSSFYKRRILNIDDYLIILKDTGLAVFDKNTKKYTPISLQKEILNEVAENPLSVQLLTEELNESNQLMNIYLPLNDENIAVFVLNLDDATIHPLPSLSSPCGVYCGGPAIYHKINNDKFYLIRDGGDACWYHGVVYSLNLNNYTEEEILSMNVGCRGAGYSLIGQIRGQIISAENKWINPENYFTEGNFNDNYVNLLGVNFDGSKSILISPEDMPANIDFVWLDVSTDQIYLENNDNRKYYVFNYESKELNETIKHEQKFEPKMTEETDWLRDTIDYLRVESNS